MQKTFLLLFSLLVLNIYTQDYNPISLPNTFQNLDNELYWKNKKPNTDYWQQDVYYKIDAEIDEKTDIIHGKQKLIYWNNSPDTLFFVFFHLYANQAVKDSYMAKLAKAKGYYSRFGKYQKQGLGLEILSMQANGNELKTEKDNTVLKVYLEKPLLPNENIELNIIFKNYYDNGSLRRRMKMYTSWGEKHYNGAHWYPRIAVYDKKFGWTTDQHLGREFYGDFGTFDINLTFANDYIVCATGFLQNRAEMYPDSLWKKLNIENFKDKKWNSSPSIIIEREEGKKKTWHFYAENIHDFAFVADPHFRIGESEWNGIKSYSFVQEPHAAKWQNAAEYTSKIIQTFSTDFGMYGWHKMLVVDAKAGMEYPMLTMDNGSDPGYRDLFIHEVAHNWFYGMMNNNETYRPMMDEGFTQFLTSWGMEAIDGKIEVENEPTNWYVKKFKKPLLARERRVFVGYSKSAALDESTSLSTHSDQFIDRLDHDWQYWQVYSKTATMLYNLQYTLGDELFLSAMQYYVEKWKFCHPYPNDFRQSFIEYTHVDLNWFFDQWMETNKTLDYKIDKISKNDSLLNGYDITFERVGGMQMPIDFQVTDKAGKKYDFHIPNTWFTKKTDATVLPKWTGWNKLNEKYVATIQLPLSDNNKIGNIDNVVIDPSERLADYKMTDNRLKNNIDWHFDSHISNFTDRKKYQAYWRPDLWWNAYDGFKIGANIRGNFLGKLNNFNLLFGYNTRLLQMNIPFNTPNYYTNDRLYYKFSFNTPTNRIIPNSNIYIQSRFIDGLVLNKIKFSKRFKKNVRLSFAFKSMIRPNIDGNKYLLYPKEWETQKWNNKAILGLVHYFRFNKNKVRGKIKVDLETSVFSDYKDLALKFEYTGKEKKGKFDFKTRVFAQLSPTSSTRANESSLYLAGANQEEMMENKYVRTTGFFPTEWVSQYSGNQNHFHYGGGLNLRGYAGRNMIIEDELYSGALSFAKSGNSGLALNFELSFDRLVRFRRVSKFFKSFDIDMYLFGDVAIMTYNDFNNVEQTLMPRADAGLGTTFKIKKFGVLNNINPIVIRFDMPFYVSDPYHTEKQIKFRWLVGINRAF